MSISWVVFAFKALAATRFGMLKNATRSVRLELGAGLFGYRRDDGLFVIESIVPNREAPRSRYAVQLDGELFAELDAPGRRLVGDAHSHPGAYELADEEVRPSEQDILAWRRSQEALETAYVGMIVAPTERWSGGFPFADFSRPRLFAWIVEPGGRLLEATVIKEPQWQHDLSLKVQFAS